MVKVHESGKALYVLAVKGRCGVATKPALKGHVESRMADFQWRRRSMSNPSEIQRLSSFQHFRNYLGEESVCDVEQSVVKRILTGKFS